jgi:hypothetical protein
VIDRSVWIEVPGSKCLIEVLDRSGWIEVVGSKWLDHALRIEVLCRPIVMYVDTLSFMPHACSRRTTVDGISLMDIA